jgi:dCMP deaminase
MFDDVAEFHKKFGLDYEGNPRFLNPNLQSLRERRLIEELEEYFYAIKNRNLTDAFDALIDLVYIALGTAYLHGFPFKEGWKRVHKANMKKKRAEKSKDSKHNSHFDIVKPADWKAPELDDLIKNGNNHNRISLDFLFLEVAKLFSFRGTCNRGNVGAVLVKDNRIVSTGYTGSPAGKPHCTQAGCIIDPDSGGCLRTLHAESNAIAQAAKIGISTSGCTVYTTVSPCLSCAKLMVQSDIKKLYYIKEYRDTSGIEYLIENGIAVVQSLI